MCARLLLISNSTQHGGGYLDHCADEIVAYLGEVRSILFLPFALDDRDSYAERAGERLGRLGYQVSSLHRAPDPAAAVAHAEAIFTGGGNTFRLLRALYRRELLEPLRRRLGAGTPYLGTSAGANLAGPTIRTTNDMPIVEPPSFDALGLVPFQINPHYLDPPPDSAHMGETREDRIREFHEVNDAVVVGLREGAMLRVEGARMTLRGSTGARVFRRGEAPEEFLPGARLDSLLAR